MQTPWKNLRAWLIKHQAIDNSVKEAYEIRRLDLSGLSLQSLPEEFALLESLVFLNLSNNLLSELPASFVKLSKLNNLDLKRNAFKTVPKALLQLDLGVVNFSSNELEDVGTLFDIASLRVCDLSFNHLSQLELDIQEHLNLRTLNLSGNFFKVIPQSIGTLVELQRLNLSQNMIETVNNSLTSLFELEDINLSDNKITSIDESFFTLGLEHVDLCANELRTLYLSHLEDLESLSLDENPLSYIELDESFAPYLQEFSCDSCQLSEFVPLSSRSLNSLCLSSNKIKVLPENISRYENLTQLDIDNNAIAHLPYEMTNMTRLQTLYVTGNPLDEASKEVIKVLHPDICDLNMKTGIEIEEASADDLTQMARLIGVLFQIEKDFSIDFDKQLAGITKLYAAEGTILLVAKYEGKVVGMVTMQRLISSAAGDYIGQIEDLVVDEAYRKMGVGSRLINKIRFIALQEYAYQRVQLAADMDNTNALHFYTRRGFRRTNLNVFHLNK